ncbi:MAG: pitrilysin family protein [Bryobacteraceae bacterium]|jgi:predicted Zn-dependent peptidase
MSLRARVALLLCLLFPVAAQNLKEFEKRVTEFALPNGLRFLLLERHEAPVVSFHTYVNAGSVDDPSSETGLAHMFEHMAFKGTDRIGTRNYREEAEALEAVERAYDQLEAEQAKGPPAARIEALQDQVRAAIAQAQSYVEPNAYPRIIEQNGGVGLNANTGEDSTEYFYSLPANRIELWFLLESQRLFHPVFREFYKERDVVREERRMRVESSPEGKLMEMLLATAFAAHPYRQPTAGWASDLERLRAKEAREFFLRYYVPANITIGIAGDVDPREARRLAGQYFAPLPARPLPPPLPTVEPPQEGQKRVQVETSSQPFLAIVYKRPGQNHKDDPVFDVLSGILDQGRTGILYKELVRDQRIALSASASATFPAGRYPNLFLIYVVPNARHSVEENEKACYDILDRLKREPVAADALARVKTALRASLIRQLDSNAGMAVQLTFYRVNYGDWRKLFLGLEDIGRVTAGDLQRVVRQYFVESARTVAYTSAPKGEGK